MMIRTSSRIAAGFFSCAILYSLAGANMKIPVTGYVHDPVAQAIRPIEGIPGAALVGAGIDAGVRVTAAAIAQQRHFAVAVDGDTGNVLVVNLRTPGFITLECAQCSAGEQRASKIVLSESGHSAALIYDGFIQRVTGLPDRPELMPILNTGDLPSVNVLAISDDGNLLLASGEGVRLHTGDGYRNLPVTGAIHAAAFRSGSHDALIASADALTVVENVDGETSYQSFEAVPDAVGVAFLGDGRLIAASANGTVTIYDRATRAAQSVTCNCAATGLSRLSSDSAFRITDSLEKPIMIVDASLSTPAVAFVPRPQQ